MNALLRSLGGKLVTILSAERTINDPWGLGFKATVRRGDDPDYQRALSVAEQGSPASIKSRDRLANRLAEDVGGKKGFRKKSGNDGIKAAIRESTREVVEIEPRSAFLERLLPALVKLVTRFETPDGTVYDSSNLAELLLGANTSETGSTVFLRALDEDGNEVEHGGLPLGWAIASWLQEEVSDLDAFGDSPAEALAGESKAISGGSTSTGFRALEPTDEPSTDEPNVA
jgi:hypothetical protein